jgi:uncharacterized OB-fold protein
MTAETVISKRRAGEAMGGLPVADPRPRLVGDQVQGTRCAACALAIAQEAPRCPRCGSAELKPEAFGPEGTVWASTVVHLPVGRREPPFAIAYVDLDDGPRVLTHLTAPAVLPAGTEVRLVGDDAGDILAEAVR